MPKIPIAYIEFPSHDVAVSKDFYGSLFGWTFDDYGPDYAAFSDTGVAGGFNGASGEDRTKAPLVVLEVSNLEEMLNKIEAAGGSIIAANLLLPGRPAISLHRSLRPGTRSDAAWLNAHPFHQLAHRIPVARRAHRLQFGVEVSVRQARARHSVGQMQIDLAPLYHEAIAG